MINVLKAPYRGKGKTFRAPIVREDRQKNSSWASKSNKFNSKDRKNNRY